jgi:hypothetical protein
MQNKDASFFFSGTLEKEPSKMHLEKNAFLKRHLKKIHWKRNLAKGILQQTLFSDTLINVTYSFCETFILRQRHLAKGTSP